MKDENRGTVDFLSRVSMDSEQEGTQTSNADSAIREEKALQRKSTGRSMLSPQNETNQEDYVSPFSDEFISKMEKEEEEFEEETEAAEAVSSNRIQAYMMFAFVLYIIVLCIGYHYTPFEDDVPQVISVKEIEANEYLSKIDEYVLNIQAFHEETVESTEKFTNGMMGASELKDLMNKSNEKIATQQSEIKEIIVPEGYEAFQSTLIEIYSLQASMNAAAVNYASNHDDETFDILSNINNKYEETADDFLYELNHAYRS